MSLDDRIDMLADGVAERLVQRVAESQPATQVPMSLDASLSTQLGDLLHITRVHASSKGDLARATLLLLAHDPEHAEGIADLVINPQVEKYALVETSVLISLVLIALQTHIKFERSKDGKWAVSLEKKPTDTSLLRNVAKKLISCS